MGAGDSRIATEARVTLDEAKMAKAKFFSAIPELPALINRLKNEVKRDGRITLCDGARILVPSPRMVIPYLLQGDESRIMKQAGIYVDEGVREQQLDALKVGDIHDEWQSDVLQSHIEQFIALCHNAFSRAGISFSYNLPIECDAKIGLTWAETH
jgi:DNA polymerase I-like protein with 3'-5' exonuclease and polymerase domains